MSLQPTISLPPVTRPTLVDRRAKGLAWLSSGAGEQLLRLLAAWGHTPAALQVLHARVQLELDASGTAKQVELEGNCAFGNPDLTIVFHFAKPLPAGWTAQLPIESSPEVSYLKARVRSLAGDLEASISVILEGSTWGYPANQTWGDLDDDGPFRGATWTV